MGAGIFAIAAFFLLARGRAAATRFPDAPSRAARLASLHVFVFGGVLLLSMSGVFHLLSHGAGRDVLQRLDHAAIFILIAATFTPIHAILFVGPWRWGMLSFIWSFAIVGVTLKSIFFTSTPEWLGIVLYVAMGWIGLASMITLTRRYSFRFIRPLLLGGLAYTIGAAVELVDPPALVPGVVRAHELFHLAVLLGLAFHWQFAWKIAALPGPAPRGDSARELLPDLAIAPHSA